MYYLQTCCVANQFAFAMALQERKEERFETFGRGRKVRSSGAVNSREVLEAAHNLILSATCKSVMAGCRR